MTTHRGYLVVEGHGEQSSAVTNLVTRLWADLSLPGFVAWRPPIRGRALTSDDGLRRACENVRARGDAEVLLVLRDEDDACPKKRGPEAAEVIRALELPFPSAVVLAEREYESIFLASLPSIAGCPIGHGAAARPGIEKEAEFAGTPHRKRDAKGWLSSHMVGGRAYKPTVDQKPLTQMVDFDVVRESGLPWFGTLERALAFLAQSLGGSGVYPNAAVTDGS